MKKLIFITTIVLNAFLYAQSPISGTDLVFDPSLAPFYHGVASGDPTSESVILWTRVTPEVDEEITVNWRICTDPEMTNEVLSGTTTTDMNKDYTVKVDAVGLSPETSYYYTFEALGKYSIIGRTRTTPIDVSDNLKFAVVSCSNYEAGYFNAYERIAERNDLDAVIHLGDYIYEYDTNAYGNPAVNRPNFPKHEIVEEDDYRTRYSLYRLDPMLRKAHQQHPFICIWDDHETANDAYVEGAENHNPDNEYVSGKTEGDWETRKAAALKAYLEWMPIRESQGTIYRKIEYGDLADLYLLDTRIEGREIQPASQTDADTTTFRTILGETQREWLIEDLKSSDANWKVVANQVIFSQLNVGFAAGYSDGTPDITNIDSINAVEGLFLDIWDGYPQERALLLDSIASNSIDNVIILSGDFHSTFAFDVTQNPTDYPNPVAFNLPTPSMTYDPVSGAGAIAVEFVTPSITSANFDENVGAAAAAQFEYSFNNDLPTGNPALPTVNYNPHMKYTDLDRHGYFILDLKVDSVQADWYFVNSILEVDAIEEFATGMYTKTGESHLLSSGEASGPKSEQISLAPTEPFLVTDIDESQLAVFAIYPNPVVSTGVLHYAVNQGERVRIDIMNIEGKQVKVVCDEFHQAGIYSRPFSVEGLTAGIYEVRFTSSKTFSKTIVVE